MLDAVYIFEQLQRRIQILQDHSEAWSILLGHFLEVRLSRGKTKKNLPFLKRVQIPFRLLVRDNLPGRGHDEHRSRRLSLPAAYLTSTSDGIGAAACEADAVSQRRDAKQQIRPPCPLCTRPLKRRLKQSALFVPPSALRQPARSPGSRVTFCLLLRPSGRHIIC